MQVATTELQTRVSQKRGDEDNGNDSGNGNVGGNKKYVEKLDSRRCNNHHSFIYRLRMHAGAAVFFCAHGSVCGVIRDREIWGGGGWPRLCHVLKTC